MTVYIIVPAEDVNGNYKMLNHSTSKAFETVRKNNIQSKYLFESKTDPPNEIFDQYRWYSESEIMQEVENAEWLG